MKIEGIEVVPAILKKTFEGIKEDWNKVVSFAEHIQIDVTDGVFAGEASFMQIREFKRLPGSEKLELHLMVHNPGYWVDDVININPARVAFHVTAFADGGHVDMVYKKLRQETTSQLALALNPTSPVNWLEDQLPLLDYVLFLGVNPGFSGQAIEPDVFRKIAEFHDKHPNIPIAVDGGVSQENIKEFVKVGASIISASSAIFNQGNPQENIEQLRLAAESAVD